MLRELKQHQSQGHRGLQERLWVCQTFCHAYECRDLCILYFVLSLWTVFIFVYFSSQCFTLLHNFLTCPPVDLFSPPPWLPWFAPPVYFNPVCPCSPDCLGFCMEKRCHAYLFLCTFPTTDLLNVWPEFAWMLSDYLLCGTTRVFFVTVLV